MQTTDETCQPGAGYSHFKTIQATYKDVPQNGLVFCKKSLKKSQTTGLIFKIFQGLLHEPQKIVKIWCVFVAKSHEIGTFFRKIPKYWYLFLEKLPLNIGMDLELPAAHPRPIQI